MDAKGASGTDSDVLPCANSGHICSDFTMSLLRSAGSNYIGVLDVAAATPWYIEKPGLRKVTIELALGFSKNEAALVLGPSGKSTDELTPLPYASNLKKARDFLLSRGVNTGDSGGPPGNPISRCATNVIAISEEP